jgi:hypothetical protein
LFELPSDVRSGGRTSRHHVIPRSRLRNSGKIDLQEVYHTLWHYLFINMTPAESCRLVQQMMTRSGSGPRGAWTWDDFCAARILLINRTEQMRKQSRGTCLREVYQPGCFSEIDLDVHCQEVRQLWLPLFGEIATVHQAHLYINRVMATGDRLKFSQEQKWTWDRLQATQRWAAGVSRVRAQAG